MVSEEMLLNSHGAMFGDDAGRCLAGGGRVRLWFFVSMVLLAGALGGAVVNLLVPCPYIQ